MKPRGLGALTCWGHTGKRKREFVDKAAAQQYIKVKHQENKLRPVHCKEGHWHVKTTHEKK